MTKERSLVNGLLSSDQPLSNPKDDVLGYAPFAKNLSSSLLKMSPPEGLVIALNGPWGSGKSTILNFVEHYIQKATEDGDEEPIWFRFNPWWFSGREDLMQNFFSQMRAQIGDKVPAIRDNIASFAESLSSIPTEYVELLPYVGSYAGRLKKAAKIAGGVREEKNVVELKRKISESLRGRDQPIIVVIDDIDRLVAEEIRMLLRTIKAVADFPTVIYLLAFERELVAGALDQSFANRGSDYLEKIIQVPFTVPPPDSFGLQQLLTDRLNTILDVSASEDGHISYGLNRQYWSNIYGSSLRRFLRTPRQITRLTNALHVTYPAVRGDVNPVDFVAIEVLRIQAPQVYVRVRENKDLLTISPQASQNPFSGIRMTSHDQKKIKLDEWVSHIESASRQDEIKKLIRQLFPGGFGSEITTTQESEWRKHLHVRSPDIFDTYFRFSLLEDELSASRMNELVQASGDSEKFSALLLRFAETVRRDGSTKAGPALERLQDYTDGEIDTNNIPSVLASLLTIGDEIAGVKDKETKQLFTIDNDLRIIRIIYQLLPRLTQERRYDALHNAMKKGQAVSTMAQTVSVFSSEHGRYGADSTEPENERLFTASQMDKLEGVLLDKIKELATEGSIFEAPNPDRLLYWWKTLGNEDDVQGWVQRSLEADQNLAAFVKAFGGWVTSQSGKRTHRYYRINPKRLVPYVDVGQIIDRVRDLKTDNRFTEEQKTALAQLEKEYDMTQRGEDPDAHRWWDQNR